MYYGLRTKLIASFFTLFLTACGGGSGDNENEKDVTTTDTTAPTIILVGDNPMTIDQGTIFVEPGSTVTDNVDNDLIATVTGTVDTLTVGDYTLTYSVSDSAGNTATVTRTVTVIDVTAPVIELIGDDSMVVLQGTVFTDPGVTVTDNVDLTLSSEVSGTVDTTTIGSYILTYTAFDTSGNEAEVVTRTVHVIDVSTPVITLLGNNPLTVAHGSSFIDPGSMVTDNDDTDLIASVSGIVDTATVGSYTLTYNASDNLGNNAIAVTRKVNVVDTTAPVITLIGDNPMMIVQGTVYTDPGVTITDNVDENLVAVVTGTVDPLTVGNYILTYAVSDSAGNTAIALTRTITVADMSAPVITLLGDNPMTIAQGASFNDPGSMVTDNVDIGLAATVTGTVDTAKVGNYTLIYSVSDTSGNVATAVTRTVRVTDQSAPEITLLGNNPMTIAQGSNFTDPGATVTDNVDVGLTATVSGTVDTTTVGDYILTYSVSDAKGNVAIAVIRTVIVADQSAPVITLIGDNPMTVAQGSSFVDPGVTVIDNVDTGLTASVTGSVDTATVGSYTLTYSVSDAKGNAATAITRTVIVADQSSPEITLIGNNPMTVAQGSSFNDPGSTVTDNVDTGLTATVSGTVDTAIVGNYTLTYSVSDAKGNAAISVTRTVIVDDMSAPVITLLGFVPMTVAQGSSFVDPGSTVTDNVDTGLTATVTGTVDTLTVGDYILNYDVSDLAGNAAITMTRTVSVVDLTDPVITLIGNDPMTVTQGSIFVDPGTTVTDNVDTGLVADVSGAVDTDIVGNYILTYSVTDTSGNVAETLTRTVTVVDVTAPVITLIGNDPMTIAQGASFNDPGTTVTDNVDTGLTAVVTGTVDTLTVGEYILIYDISDNAGNAATPVTRTVNVVDQTAPVITLLGDDPMTHPFGDPFTDPGSAVTDNVDNGLTATVTGTVNTTLAGDYLLTYNVSDNAGIAAVTITRTVTISPAIFKLSAGLYDTCAYTGDDRKLRCFGYNDGAHGNGLMEQIGDSFGEAKRRFEVCKASEEQVLTFVISDDPSSPCGDYYAPKIVEWFEQGNDTSLGSYTYCPSKYDQIITTTLQEESEACDEGAYAFYWGEDSNDDSTLSTNEMGAALIPTILPDSELLAFDVADSYGCGIFADQTTRCWGSNINGQLGRGAVGEVLTEGELGNALIPVNFGDGLYATEIHLSDSSSACALLNNGRIKCWGRHTANTLGFVTDTDIGLTPESMGNNLLPLDLGTNPDTLEPYKTTTMALNSRNGCAVLDNGGVKCWGVNNYGSLGLGEENRYPEQVYGDHDGEMGDNLDFVLLGDFHAIAVATGYHFQCALSDNNRIKCWGQNDDGQLGISDIESRGNGHEDAYAKSVYIHNDSVYDIKPLNTGNDGLTLCPTAPENKGVQLDYGQDDGSPSGIAGNGILEDGEIITTKLVCDTEYVIAFAEIDPDHDEDHNIKLAYGLYGHDYAEMGNGLPSVDLGVNEVIIKIDANYYNTCALVDTSKVKCWGYSKTGGADSTFNIGDAPERSVALADYMDFGTTDKVVDITMGGYQSCVIFETGSVKCWGYNEYGETGQPAFEGDYLGDGLPNPEMGVNLPFVDLR